MWFNDGDLANKEGKMVLRPDANRGVPNDADAKLIAAAPKLMEAVEKAMAILEADDSREAAIEILQIAWGEATSL